MQIKEISDGWVGIVQHFSIQRLLVEEKDLRVKCFLNNNNNNNNDDDDDRNIFSFVLPGRKSIIHPRLLALSGLIFDFFKNLPKKSLN